jgi:hypothetical protein
MRLRLVTLGERPDLLPALRRLTEAVWPPTMEYVHHDAVCGRHWPALAQHFADFQPVLCDGRGRVVAGGYTIPFVWDGRRATLPSGVDGVLVRGVRDRRQGRHPTALSALLAVVDPRQHGRGLSRVVIRAMQGRVREWERWTRMRFPASGRYVVPGALVPIAIDRRRDRGRYVEPNVWMLHPV